jgi:hypothetical protein
VKRFQHALELFRTRFGTLCLHTLLLHKLPPLNDAFALSSPIFTLILDAEGPGAETVELDVGLELMEQYQMEIKEKEKLKVTLLILPTILTASTVDTKSNLPPPPTLLTGHLRPS